MVIPFSVKSGIRIKGIFPVIKSIKYIYINKDWGRDNVFQKV